MELLGANNIACHYIGSIYPYNALNHRIAVSRLRCVTTHIATNECVSVWLLGTRNV